MIDHLADRRCRMVTLTIRTYELSLREAILKLYTCFSKLRQTVYWRTHVTGGCAVCEVKRTKDNLRWHPHLHLLVEGKYMLQAVLAQHWLKLTGDSYIVHIFAVDTTTDAARYITKYLSKPVPSRLLHTHDYLLEAIQALEGRRMVTTFGSWRGVKLTHTESTQAWSNMCTFLELVNRALAGDAASKLLLSHLLGHANHDPTDTDNWLRATQALHDKRDAMIRACHNDTPNLFT